MDAVTLLNEHIDMVKLLEHYDFDHIHVEGNMVRSCCKLHGGNNPTAFVANLENHLWFCHTGSCGGGDAYTLVERMEGIGFQDAVRWLAQFFGVDIDNLQIVERQADYMTEMKRWFTLMRKRTKKRRYEAFTIPEPIHPVAKFRDFHLDTLKHFGLGYVDSIELERRDGGKYRLNHRLLFPIVQDGIQIGVSIRRTKSSDVPKWSHQPAHIETKELLYNYDATKDGGTVVVVEGIPDVWAYYEIGVVAVATFGAHLTHEQYALLLKTGADIVLSYDGDEAGQLATVKAIEQLKNKTNLSLVSFQPGEDPENIGREELRKRYANITKCH